jgi:hypothetical protein
MDEWLWQLLPQWVKGRAARIPLGGVKIKVFKHELRRWVRGRGGQAGQADMLLLAL